MKKRITCFPVFFTGVFLLFNLSLSAQQPTVSVDNFTGSPLVTVPIGVVRSGSSTLPIAISYGGSGVKVKDAEGTAGMGWNLMVGGEIRREVRGLPDDLIADDSGNARTGWLYSTNGTKINNFAIANDNNNATCADANADIDYLNTNFSDLSDTEPDVFYLNIPGVSCQLIFDKDHNVRTVPFQDIKVSYVTETDSQGIEGHNKIRSFFVTTDQGLQYTFSDKETVYKTTETSSDPANIKYFKREYDQYKYGIQYTSAWRLTSIGILNGNNEIYLYYKDSPAAQGASKRISLTVGSDTTRIVPYSILMGFSAKILDRIVYDNYDGIISTNGKNNLKFTYINASTSSAPIISAISGPAMNAGFGYVNAGAQNPISTDYRYFLTSVYINQQNSLQFDYNGLVINQALANQMIDLPDSLSKEIDQWGYYNKSGATSLLPQVYINPNNNGLERYRTQQPGANAAQYSYTLSGNARSVNPATVINGALKTITRYYGGTTSFVYEPNDYYDVTAGTVVQGGGIRVKQIIDYEGVKTANNTIRNYSYINPSTGLSSGKPLSLPLLAFEKPYLGAGTIDQQWQNSTVRLEESVSPENNAIVYTNVKTDVNGAGSTLYEYLAPATYWDASAAPDWTPTVVNIAGVSCSSVGLMTNQVNTYPFAQNPNFDFERGLLKKVALYDDNNNKLKESTYTYARKSTSTVVQGLKFDYIDGAMAYAKYSVVTGADNLVTQELDMEYDASSASPARQTTVNSYYQGTNHNLMTSRTTTAQDGSILRNYIKYTKDYPATSAGSDAAGAAIYNLQLKNANLPVESYTQVERSGLNKTISASLVRFGAYITNTSRSIIMPSQKLTFLRNDGVTDFQASGLTGNVFTNDSRYNVTENDLIYDLEGQLLTKDDNNKNVSTALTDYRSSSPVVQINGASADQIAFNNFEDDNSTYSGFTINYSKIDSTSCRSGQRSMAITSADSFTRTLLKSSTADNAVFSVWIKSASAGNLTLSLTNSSATVYTYPIAYTNTAGEWKYYEVSVPLLNMSDNFTAKYQSSTSISVDDILFYPDNASANTIAYDPANYLKTSETNTNGKSNYFVYDNNRRLRYVMDQDKNIVMKNSYVKDTDISNFMISINGSSFANAGVPASFSTSTTSNKDGIVYTWNFGDGTPQVTTTDSSPLNHTYAANGSYTVTLTGVSPYLGTASATQNMSVSSSAVTIAGSYPGGNFGTINWVKFYKGSTLMYTFTGDQLSSATPPNLPADTYNVQVSMLGTTYSTSNPNGYRRVNYQLSSGFQDCVPAATGTQPKAGTVYSFPVNLTGQTRMFIRADVSECIPDSV